MWPLSRALKLGFQNFGLICKNMGNSEKLTKNHCKMAQKYQGISTNKIKVFFLVKSYFQLKYLLKAKTEL